MKQIYKYSLLSAAVAALVSFPTIAFAQSETVVVGESEKATVATFEDLGLESESYWTGPADNADETDGAYGKEWVGTFTDGSLNFSNSFNPSYESWYGCAYSNKTSTSFSTYDKDQWNSCVGHGAEGSATYGVLYGNSIPNFSTKVIQTENNEERIIKGMYVTNSAWVIECVENGNGMAKKFEKGSYFKVIFTGTKSDGSSTSPIELFLADYTSDNEADWSCLKDWKWVDLSSLGNIVSLSISFDGTDKTYGYLNTSTYVCVDNIVSEKASATGISNVESDASVVEVARYTVDGKRIGAPQKGINIIRMSDGTTRKVVVK